MGCGTEVGRVRQWQECQIGHFQASRGQYTGAHYIVLWPIEYITCQGFVVTIRFIVSRGYLVGGELAAVLKRLIYIMRIALNKAVSHHLKC